MALAAVFIIAAAYPSFVFIRQGKLKTLWGSNVNKILIIALAYAALSSLWAIKPGDSITMVLRMGLFFIGANALFAYVETIEDKQKILKAVLWGVVAALIFPNLEIFTSGFITGHLHPSLPENDYLVQLNRGSSFVTVISWAAIAYLFTKANYKAAFALFIAVLATVARLESFSSTLGFLAGGLIVFPLVYYKKEKAIKIFAVLAVIFVFAVAAAAKLMDANKLVGNVPVVTGAASNFRLYIWDYTAEQAYKKPVFGWGMNSAKSYPVQESDYVQGGRNPLPLHPHNNTLQIWLELGAVGLVMFASFLYFVLLRIPQVMQDKFIMASGSALFTNYFLIGQTAYGIWQNWWVAGGILALAFLKLTTFKSKN